MKHLDSEHTSARIVITCIRGCGHLLLKEIKRLKYKHVDATPSYVTVRGTLVDCIRLNLELFTAQRVLYQLGEYRCETPDDLYRHVLDLPWEIMISVDGYLSVSCTVNTSSIRDSRFVNVRAKDAIVDRLVQTMGSRCNSGPDRSNAVVHVHWSNTLCRVFLDTSGDVLSRRGYRLFPWKAPMQECLAAAVILGSTWTPRLHFVNPMCGSGTLAIEAALLASRKAPGTLRTNFGFMHLLGYDKRLFDAARAEALEHESQSLDCTIVASDIDKEAVGIARKNAEAAGVAKLIEFHTCDFADTPLPDGEGIVIMNPEYGLRMGETRELGAVYKRIGDFFKTKCRGYTGCVFTGSAELAGRIGLKPVKKTPFDNGGIDCRLLEYSTQRGGD